MADLAKDHRVIAIDLKGFGRSPKPTDGKYSIFDQAELVKQFIVEKDFHHLTLAGHSFGGGVALATALELSGSARLDRLVLIDSIAYAQRLPYYIRILSFPFLGALVLKTLPAKFCVKLVLRLAYYNRALITEEVVGKYAPQLGAKGAHHALLWTVRLLMRVNVDHFSSQYRSLALPVLLIWGEKDRIVPIDVAYRLREQIPGARLVSLANSGHNPPEEQPGETAKAIREFMMF